MYYIGEWRIDMKIKTIRFVVILIVPIVGLQLFIGTAISKSNTLDDFLLISFAQGVNLYRKDYDDGNPDFVQEVNLSQSASIELLHGGIINEGKNQGVYGGDDPWIQRQTLEEAWENFSTSSDRAFCITNGQFFSTNDNPTPLAFPLKTGGVIVSDGYGINEFPNEKLMLEIWKDRVNISLLSQEALMSSNAPDIVVGLNPVANKNPEGSIGRTFIGIKDDNSDGQYEEILVFSTKTARQIDAVKVLQSFGAEKIMMLDGGGSTQLICGGIGYVVSDRTIPQTIAVQSGDIPTTQALVVSKPDWPILVEQDSLSVEIVIKNVGLDIWTPEEYSLVNVTNPWGEEEMFKMPTEIRPGETVSFTWTTSGFNGWGVFSTKWQVSNGTDTSVNELIEFSVVVLPEELEAKRQELQEEVDQWVDEQTQNIEQLIVSWIQQQVNKTINETCIPTATFFPLIFVMILFMRNRPGIMKDKRNKKEKN